MPEKRKHPNKSVKKLIEELWQENFFIESRELGEISNALAAKGYNQNIKILSVALLRSVHSGLLTRNFSSGRWKYIQKQPAHTMVGQRTQEFSQYEFHPKVVEVSLKQFQNGHFKEAIQNAFVEVIDQVKIQSGNPKKQTNGRMIDLDGDDLMGHVFGCEGHEPIISFNSLSTSLDRAEQKGFMHLYKGVVGIRDKKAHLNFVQKDPIKTIEYLSLASLLLRLLDENPRSKSIRRRKRK
jgi:uncharacterized protein (TIGR02391 family)